MKYNLRKRNEVFFELMQHFNTEKAVREDLGLTNVNDPLPDPEMELAIKKGWLICDACEENIEDDLCKQSADGAFVIHVGCK